MNSDLFPDSPPVHAGDGTFTAIVATPARTLGVATIITLHMPPDLAHNRLAGRYFLARCGASSIEERAENWQCYFRRPLFAVSRRFLAQADMPAESWQLWAPGSDDHGYRWLAGLAPGAAVNMIGPLGNGFFLPLHSRHLLLVTDTARIPLLLNLIEDTLDKGGHVTIALLGPQVDARVLAMLPVAVEVRHVSPGNGWASGLREELRWADHLCSTLPAPYYHSLANAIRQHRFRLEPGFALMLVDADLICGTGACLACVVPLGNGNLTRACVHGPVFDLLELVTS